MILNHKRLQKQPEGRKKMDTQGHTTAMDIRKGHWIHKIAQKICLIIRQTLLHTYLVSFNYIFF